MTAKYPKWLNNLRLSAVHCSRTGSCRYWRHHSAMGLSARRKRSAAVFCFTTQNHRPVSSASLAKSIYGRMALLSPLTAQVRNPCIAMFLRMETYRRSAMFLHNSADWNERPYSHDHYDWEELAYGRWNGSNGKFAAKPNYTLTSSRNSLLPEPTKHISSRSFGKCSLGIEYYPAQPGGKRDGRLARASVRPGCR